MLYLLKPLWAEILKDDEADGSREDDSKDGGRDDVLPPPLVDAKLLKVGVASERGVGVGAFAHPLWVLHHLPVDHVQGGGGKGRLDRRLRREARDGRQ